jgi:hypothetical protein
MESSEVPCKIPVKVNGKTSQVNRRYLTLSRDRDYKPVNKDLSQVEGTGGKNVKKCQVD